MVLINTFDNLAGTQMRRWRARVIGLSAVASVPAVIAGISLLVGAGGGLYWLLLEFVTGIAVAAYSSVTDPRRGSW